MKTSIIIAVIALGAIFSTNTATANTYPSVSSLSATPLRITITINIGARSKDCSGFGICSIVISANMASESIKPSNNSSVGTADVVNGKMTINFKKSSMTREAIAKYFANGQFRVDEDYQVAQEIVAPRDVATGQASGKRQYQPLIIRKGVYNVKDNGDSLTVAF